MEKKNIASLRKDYHRHRLDDSAVDGNPFRQFALWFDEVAKTPIGEVNAMNLSTAGRDGKVSSRMMLLKSFDEEGFVFFTNYRSEKGKDLEENPYAGINFFWFTKERQVRISGPVHKIPEQDSEAYFHSRPRGSQLAALVSEWQSAPAGGRDELEEKYRELEKKYEGKSIPRPKYWGGYLLVPELFEFWQGRPNRLHDRIRYRRLESGQWDISRLYP